MKVYFGGQIGENRRGKLAVVVMQDGTGRYTPHLNGMHSKEFFHLTGAMNTKKIPVRVYIGVSQDAGEHLVELTANGNAQTVDLREVDQAVVIPLFVDRNQEKPNRIVLESTLDGYSATVEPR